MNEAKMHIKISIDTHPHTFNLQKKAKSPLYLRELKWKGQSNQISGSLRHRLEFCLSTLSQSNQAIELNGRGAEVPLISKVIKARVLLIFGSGKFLAHAKVRELLNLRTEILSFFISFGRSFPSYICMHLIKIIIEFCANNYYWFYFWKELFLDN